MRIITVMANGGSMDGPTEIDIRPGQLRPAEGITHAGERFLLGFGANFYAIYDKTENRPTPSEPVALFAKTNEGWEAAWKFFTTWEPKPKSVNILIKPEIRSGENDKYYFPNVSSIIQVPRAPINPKFVSSPISRFSSGLNTVNRSAKRFRWQSRLANLTGLSKSHTNKSATHAQALALRMTLNKAWPDEKTGRRERKAFQKSRKHATKIQVSNPSARFQSLATKEVKLPLLLSAGNRRRILRLIIGLATVAVIASGSLIVFRGHFNHPQNQASFNSEANNQCQIMNSEQKTLAGLLPTNPPQTNAALIASDVSIKQMTFGTLQQKTPASYQKLYSGAWHNVQTAISLESNLETAYQSSNTAAAASFMAQLSQADNQANISLNAVGLTGCDLAL